MLIDHYEEQLTPSPCFTPDANEEMSSFQCRRKRYRSSFHLSQAPPFRKVKVLPAWGQGKSLTPTGSHISSGQQQ